MNTVHPIELFIAALINLFEFTCWVINELAGFHQPNIASAPETTSNKPAPTPTPTPPTTSNNYAALTVKQLRKITGITNSRYLKADLIRMAQTYA